MLVKTLEHINFTLYNHVYKNNDNIMESFGWFENNVYSDLIIILEICRESNETNAAFEQYV